ncbi:MAG: hypothetical protein A3E84_04940 [Gammaproteobacteria bacterium RIFCSPHIGHO2_12_FULL_42_13]|nr:MAG: hypothetical protein A3E84_04940 [Gammaproteobacteria bacterium RIFCSPHIGHO2_12_FULL_42_13]
MRKKALLDILRSQPTYNTLPQLLRAASLQYACDHSVATNAAINHFINQRIQVRLIAVAQSLLLACLSNDHPDNTIRDMLSALWPNISDKTTLKTMLFERLATIELSTALNTRNNIYRTVGLFPELLDSTITIEIIVMLIEHLTPKTKDSAEKTRFENSETLLILIEKIQPTETKSWIKTLIEILITKLENFNDCISFYSALGVLGGTAETPAQAGRAIRALAAKTRDRHEQFRHAAYEALTILLKRTHLSFTEGEGGASFETFWGLSSILLSGINDSHFYIFWAAHRALAAFARKIPPNYVMEFFREALKGSLIENAKRLLQIKGSRKIVCETLVILAERLSSTPEYLEEAIPALITETNNNTSWETYEVICEILRAMVEKIASPTQISYLLEMLLGKIDVQASTLSHATHDLLVSVTMKATLPQLTHFIDELVEKIAGPRDKVCKTACEMLNAVAENIPTSTQIAIINHLLEKTRTLNNDVQQMVCNTLRTVVNKISTPTQVARTIGLLVIAINDPNTHVLEAACKALGDLATSIPELIQLAVVEQLIERTRTLNADARQTVCNTLRAVVDKISTPTEVVDVVNFLIFKISNKNNETRRALYETLAAVSKKISVSMQTDVINTVLEDEPWNNDSLILLSIHTVLTDLVVKIPPDKIKNVSLILQAGLIDFSSNLRKAACNTLAVISKKLLKPDQLTQLIERLVEDIENISSGFRFTVTCDALKAVVENGPSPTQCNAIFNALIKKITHSVREFRLPAYNTLAAIASKLPEPTQITFIQLLMKEIRSQDCLLQATLYNALAAMGEKLTAPTQIARIISVVVAAIKENQSGVTLLAAHKTLVAIAWKIPDTEQIRCVTDPLMGKINNQSAPIYPTTHKTPCADVSTTRPAPWTLCSGANFVEEMISRARSPNHSTRRQACEALPQKADLIKPTELARVLEVLVDNMDSSSPDVRNTASHAFLVVAKNVRNTDSHDFLAVAGNVTKAGEALLEYEALFKQVIFKLTLRTRHPCEQVCQTTCKALRILAWKIAGLSQNDAVITSLVMATNNQSNKVCQSACNALNAYAWEIANSTLISRVVEALAAVLVRHDISAFFLVAHNTFHTLVSKIEEPAQIIQLIDALVAKTEVQDTKICQAACIMLGIMAWRLRTSGRLFDVIDALVTVATTRNQSTDLCQTACKALSYVAAQIPNTTRQLEEVVNVLIKGTMDPVTYPVARDALFDLVDKIEPTQVSRVIDVLIVNMKCAYISDNIREISRVTLQRIIEKMSDHVHRPEVLESLSRAIDALLNANLGSMPTLDTLIILAVANPAIHPLLAQKELPSHWLTLLSLVNFATQLIIPRIPEFHVSATQTKLSQLTKTLNQQMEYYYQQVADKNTTVDTRSAKSTIAAFIRALYSESTSALLENCLFSSSKNTNTACTTNSATEASKAFFAYLASEGDRTRCYFSVILGDPEIALITSAEKLENMLNGLIKNTEVHIRPIENTARSTEQPIGRLLPPHSFTQPRESTRPRAASAHF